CVVYVMAFHPVSFRSLCAPPRRPTLFPYTTLFRSRDQPREEQGRRPEPGRDVLDPRSELEQRVRADDEVDAGGHHRPHAPAVRRSEEHTSELQSHLNLVCRLLLEKKKAHKIADTRD